MNRSAVFTFFVVTPLHIFKESNVRRESKITLYSIRQILRGSRHDSFLIVSFNGKAEKFVTVLALITYFLIFFFISVLIFQTIHGFFRLVLWH